MITPNPSIRSKGFEKVIAYFVYLFNSLKQLSLTLLKVALHHKITN